MYNSNCFEQLVHNIFKKGDGEFHALFFVIFVISNLLAKRNMLSNQVEREIIKHVCKWDDHIIMTWDYENINVIYFLGQEKENMMWIFLNYWRIYCTRTYHWHYMLELKM
jgi:hypothetical protein